MANVRLGVVGTGEIANFHFPAFHQTQTRVTIIADVNRQAAQRHLDACNAAYTESYEEVVSHPEVDAVVILAPSAFHYPIAKAAMENGKHVICEKTLSLSAHQSLELCTMARQSGVLLFCNYMKRFFPAVRKAKELMSRLGHITSLYCRTYQIYGGIDCYTGEIHETQKMVDGKPSPIMKKSGGGVLVCGGSHVYDLLLYLMGKPASVYGRQYLREGSDVDINTHAMLSYADGCVAHFEGNWHPLKGIGYEKRGWDEGFEITGTRGRLELRTPIWNEPWHNAPLLRFYDDETMQWTDYTTDIVDPFAAAEAYYLSCIEQEDHGEVDPFNGYRVDYLLEMTQASFNEHRPIDLDWKA